MISPESRNAPLHAPKQTRLATRCHGATNAINDSRQRQRSFPRSPQGWRALGGDAHVGTPAAGRRWMCRFCATLPQARKERRPPWNKRTLGTPDEFRLVSPTTERAWSRRARAGKDAAATPLVKRTRGVDGRRSLPNEGTTPIPRESFCQDFTAPRARARALERAPRKAKSLSVETLGGRGILETPTANENMQAAGVESLQNLFD